MGNLSDLLKNPTSQVDTVAALVEAVLLDEQASGGSGTSGFIAQFDSDTSLKDSIIDYGVTAAEGLTAQNPGTGGTSILDSGGGGILIQDSATSGGGLKIKGSAGLSLISSNDSDESVTDSEILIISGDGLHLTNDPTTDLASAVTITSTGTGGISLDGGAGGILVRPYLVPSLLYSAAGIALPTPSSALIGAQAVVSDAVAPAYMAAYTGGALGVLCAVICDGTTWFTH